MSIKNENLSATIGISTYNRADSYLKCALDSAVSQTWPNLEIIVADNCSSDNTRDLVKSYSDPRIKYHRHRENIGAARNFNFCVKQARGDYFLLLHDDDVIDSDFIETCMNAVSRKGHAGIIRTGTRVIDARGLTISEKPNHSTGLSNTDFLLNWFSDKTSLYLCSTMFRTDALREIGGFLSQKHLFDDVAAILRLAYKLGRVDIPDIKAGFRRHDENYGSTNLADAWCQDSEFILSIIDGMETEQKKLVMKKARYFFTRKCYRYVQGERSAALRFLKYIQIYRRFGYAYAPTAYLYKSRIRPRLTLYNAKNRMYRSIGLVKA